MEVYYHLKHCKVRKQDNLGRKESITRNKSILLWLVTKTVVYIIFYLYTLQYDICHKICYKSDMVHDNYLSLHSDRVNHTVDKLPWPVYCVVCVCMYFLFIGFHYKQLTPYHVEKTSSMLYLSRSFLVFVILTPNTSCKIRSSRYVFSQLPVLRSPYVDTLTRLVPDSTSRRPHFLRLTSSIVRVRSYGETFWHIRSIRLLTIRYSVVPSST